MANATLSLSPADARPMARTVTHHERVRELVEKHADFVWRVLRRLGVPAADTDDQVQQVFLVLARRLSDLEPGCERSFLYETSLRVASEYRRRAAAREQLEQLDAVLSAVTDPVPQPDEEIALHQARTRLDQILGAMPLELSATFVLYELEELSAREIAELQGVKMGTAASRIRKARELFDAHVMRLEEGAFKGGRTR